MRTRCYILLLLVSAMMILCACDAKRRAQRRIRRITERCPELLTVQAHPFDTIIQLPPVADTAVMPLAPLLDGQAVKIQTEQGIFTASAANDSLSITYNAEQEPVHYSDTLRYSQVVVNEEPSQAKTPSVLWFLLGMVIGLLAILATIITIIIKIIKAS